MGCEEVPFAELLSQIVDNRGKTCPTADTGIPLIATNCIRNDLLYPAYEKIRYVSQATFETWFRGHPKPGDLIFVTKGTPGRVCMAPDPVDFCIAQDMVAVRANPKMVYPEYLLAALRSPIVQMRIEQMHVGTLIPHFKKGDFDKLFLPIPDRDAQTFIGDTYFELSAKIELNRRMNETLEEMAQAIFRSWFVNFEPVRAKVTGRQPHGLSPDIAALFPDAFDDSELGEIPEGWGIEPIGDLVEAVGGGTPSTKNPAYWDDGIHYFATPKSLSGLPSPILLETERKVTDAGLAKISSGLLPVGTVLLSSRAPVGYLAITQVPVCINQGFIAMICDGKISNYYVLNWAHANMAEIKMRAGGTTFAEISKRNFRPIPALVPPTEVVAAFDAVVEPLYTKVRVNLEESRTLAELRDTLLPKLISGELRVEDTENMLGRYLSWLT